MFKSIFYCIITLLLASCGSLKPITSTIKPTEIKKIGLVLPFSGVKVLKAKNNDLLQDENYDDEITVNAADAIQGVCTDLSIESELISLNNNDLKIVANETSKYMKALVANSQYRFNFDENRQIFSKIQVSEQLSAIIKKNDQRFALITVVAGFTRTPRNEKNRVAANTGLIIGAIALAALTGGTIYARLPPANTTSYFFLIDAESKNLAMYIQRRSEFDPIVRELLQYQLKNELKAYWLIEP
jgi:hypothetical protein